MLHGKILPHLALRMTLCLTILVGCAEPGNTNTGTPTLPTSILMERTPRAPLEVPAALMENAVKGNLPSFTPFEIEELASIAGVIARVNLVKVSEHVEVRDELYTLEAHYEFEALEYLKGRGGSKLWGVVTLGIEFDTEQDARRALAYLLESRNKQWDNREAIVFFPKPEYLHPSTQMRTSLGQENYHYLGAFHVNNHGNGILVVEDFSIAAYGSWLPVASEKSGISGASGEQRFLLEDSDGHFRGYSRPNTWGSTGGSGTSHSSTVSLSRLRQLSAVSDEQWKEWAEATAVAFRPTVEAWVTVLNLQAAATPDSVTLTWEISELDSVDTGYRIWRQIQGESDFLVLTDLESDERSYVDTTNLQPDTEYRYRVETLTEGETRGNAQVSITTRNLQLANTPAP